MGVDLAGIKDKLQSGNIREAFDGLKTMVDEIKAKKEDIAKLGTTPPAPAEPPKK